MYNLTSSCLKQGTIPGHFQPRNRHVSQAERDSVAYVSDEQMVVVMGTHSDRFVRENEAVNQESVTEIPLVHVCELVYMRLALNIIIHEVHDHKL